MVEDRTEIHIIFDNYDMHDLQRINKLLSVFANYYEELILKKVFLRF